MNTLHTGGAYGSDAHWEKVAKDKNHTIKIYHFDGHKHTRVETTGEQNHILIEHTNNYERDIKKTAKHLKREIKSDYEKHLLERDWNLVTKSKATSLYAIGRFIDDDSRLKVQGGTAWIIELYLEHCDIKREESNLSLKALPIYFTNIDNGNFYQLCINNSNEFKWERVEQFPEPKGNWIGIGTRKL